jgi:phage protein D
VLGPGRGRSGAQVLGETLGARPHHISHIGITSASEASAVAAAAYESFARRFVVVEGTADGNPALRVGTHVSLSGMGGRFDNTYYVVLARHRYDLRGYETDFTAECAFLGAGV